jgi:hypothetical protein
VIGFSGENAPLVGAIFHLRLALGGTLERSQSLESTSANP